MKKPNEGAVPQPSKGHAAIQDYNACGDNRVPHRVSSFSLSRRVDAAPVDKKRKQKPRFQPTAFLFLHGACQDSA
jgi:hypothetical protein